MLYRQRERERERDFIVYAHGRRLCSNRFRHGSTTISYPQCSLTFLCERYLHRCREQSFPIRAYAMSAVGIDVVSSHTKYCRSQDSRMQDTNELMTSDFMAFKLYFNQGMG